MKTAAVICELNPFHSGHLRVFEAAREMGADRVIAIMSGDFVQRGAPAVIDARSRAECALKCGADLVLLLPAVYATASAEGFASGAVGILDKLGCVDILVFGSECGDTARLKKCAAALIDESDGFRAGLREGLRMGLSFPAARQRALGGEGDILGGPNDILGVEYMKALMRLGSGITPVAVKRLGMGHHDLSGEDGAPSGTAIRRALIEEGAAGIEMYEMPGAAREILRREFALRGASHEDDLTEILCMRLSEASSDRDLTCFSDVTEDLARTVMNNRFSFSSFSELASLSSSKSLTYTHASRALLHIALGMRREGGGDIFPAIVLGVRESARGMINELASGGGTDVVTLSARSIRESGPALGRMLSEEARISDLYRMIRGVKAGKSPMRSVLSEPLIVV